MEVIKVTEAVEVIETVQVPYAWEITQYVNSKSIWFFKAKEADEVIEASDVIMSVEFIEATEVSIALRPLKPIS